MTPPEPPKRVRKGNGKRADYMTPERLSVLVAVYGALGTARLNAGMPAPHAVPYLLRKAHEDGTVPELTADSSALLRCLVQLEEGAHGEPMSLADAEQLLVATVRAKVAEHAKRDDDFATGKHATIGTLVVKSNFGKWLAAGRAFLAKATPAAGPAKRAGPIVIDGTALTEAELEAYRKAGVDALGRAEVRAMRVQVLEEAPRKRLTLADVGLGGDSSAAE